MSFIRCTLLGDRGFKINCMDILPTCNVYAHVCLYYACLASAFGSQKEDVGSPELEFRVTGGCKLPCGC